MLVLGVEMGGRTGVPVRVRRVSSELRELRLRSGLGAEEVATALGMSMSKLSRMESGQRGLYADDVSALLGLYRVPAPRREELLALVRNGADRNWWQVQDGRLPAMWEDLMQFEAEASVIHNYETMVVPGLLQTADYAEAIIRGATDNLSDAEVQGLVSARLRRQAILGGDDSPILRVLLDEAVLHRSIGDEKVLSRQLAWLLTVAQQRHVGISVVPLNAGAHPGVEGPFVLLEYVTYPSLVYLEHRGNSAFLEQAEHVASTRLALRRLRDLALSPDDSLALIASLADEHP